MLLLNLFCLCLVALGAAASSELEDLLSAIGSATGSAPGSGVDCNGHGYVYYQGPNNRTICSCDDGWKGLNCSTPMTTKDYGPEHPCPEPGFNSTCEEGMQCLAPTWNPLKPFCACDFESTNPYCQQNATENIGKALSCRFAGCPKGMRCGMFGCECEPFSKHPVCQCTGEYFDMYSGAPVECKRGESGFCVPVDENSTSWCDNTGMSAPAPGIDTCTPGKAPNNVGQCVCLPLSINPDCQGNPPPNDTVSNVCAMFPPSCKLGYNVSYAVYQSDVLVAEGNTTVKPLRNYLIVEHGIKADEAYELCSFPVESEHWNITYPDYDCTRMDGTRCCRLVTASLGSTNFTNGCADWQSSFVNTTTC